MEPNIVQEICNKCCCSDLKIMISQDIAVILADIFDSLLTITLFYLLELLRYSATFRENWCHKLGGFRNAVKVAPPTTTYVGICVQQDFYCLLLHRAEGAQNASHLLGGYFSTEIETDLQYYTNLRSAYVYRKRKMCAFFSTPCPMLHFSTF